MKDTWKLLWLNPGLALLFFVAQLGSVGSALGLGGYVVMLGLLGYVTRKRPGRHYDKKAPGRAEAELSGWTGAVRVVYGRELVQRAEDGHGRRTMRQVSLGLALILAIAARSADVVTETTSHLRRSTRGHRRSGTVQTFCLD